MRYFSLVCIVPCLLGLVPISMSAQSRLAAKVTHAQKRHRCEAVVAAALTVRSPDLRGCTGF